MKNLLIFILTVFILSACSDSQGDQNDSTHFVSGQSEISKEYSLVWPIQPPNGIVDAYGFQIKHEWYLMYNQGRLPRVLLPVDIGYAPDNVVAALSMKQAILDTTVINLDPVTKISAEVLCCKDGYGISINKKSPGQVHATIQ